MHSRNKMETKQCKYRQRKFWDTRQRIEEPMMVNGDLHERHWNRIVFQMKKRQKVYKMFFFFIGGVGASTDIQKYKKKQ